jgi:hypothetical protein
MAYALTMEEKIAKVEAKKVAQEALTRTRPTDGRARRGVFNGTSQKLAVHGDIPGYHLHIFNDEPGRIEEAQAAGYEFVEPKEIGSVANSVVSGNTAVDTKVRFLVGKTSSGDGMYAYLMKIKNEWHEEDQEDLQSRNDMVDQAIRSGQNVKAGTSTEGFYAPVGGIKMTTR